MTPQKFIQLLRKEVNTYKSFLETDSQDWIVKGFIDIDKNVYTITNDTKVVSKIIEILLIPKLDAFAQKNGLELDSVRIGDISEKEIPSKTWITPTTPTVLIPY